MRNARRTTTTPRVQSETDLIMQAAPPDGLSPNPTQRSCARAAAATLAAARTTAATAATGRG